MTEVVNAARTPPGEAHFDIARDITDPTVIVATEVFEDRAAMEREAQIPEIAEVVELMGGGALMAQPEWTIYEVASSESPSMG